MDTIQGNGGGYYQQDEGDGEAKTLNPGGGASHIALSSGQLRDFVNNKEDVLIVAGGGGVKRINGGINTYFSNLS